MDDTYLPVSNIVHSPSYALALSGANDTRTVSHDTLSPSDSLLRKVVRATGNDMAKVQSSTEARRRADLAVIADAFHVHMPNVQLERCSLSEVAKICNRDYAVRSARNQQDARDQLLLIGLEWDLARDRDRLAQQSDRCVHAIATFLR